MAEVKISQLTDYPAPLAADVFPVVDTLNSTTKKVSFSNLIIAIANFIKTLTNTTFDTAGAGNVLKINGTAVSDKTGTGKAVLDISPTITSPNISQIINSGTLSLPNTTDTLVGRATTDTLSNKTFVAPALGTPASGDLSNTSGNATGLTSGITKALKSATASVDVSAATAPSNGQVLTATGPTSANWQTPSAGSDVTGVIKIWTTASAPANYLLCDGSAVSRATYAALFAVIGTTYGAGDGSTTFNVPDLRGRMVIGTGTGSKVATFASRASNVITVTGLTSANNNEFQTGQPIVYASSGTDIGGLAAGTYYLIRISNTSFSLASSLANAQNGNAIALSSDGTGTRTFTLALSARSLGDTGGEENHSISSSEGPSHFHTISGVQSNIGSGTSGYGGANQGKAFGTTSNTDSTGNNTAMNNMVPFLALSFIIKT